MGALGFLHGVQILATESGGTAVESVSTSIICCVGTASTGEINKPVVVTSWKELCTVFGPPKDESGFYSLHLGLHGVFAQTKAICIAIRAAGKPTAKTDASDFNGSSADTAGMTAAIEEILGAESMTGFRPAILLCPGYSSLASVAGKLESVGKSLRATAILDGLNDPQGALARDVVTPSDRLYPVEPYVVSDLAWSESSPTGPRFKEEKALVMPSSGFVAGAFARSDNGRGWWHSPSNYDIIGIRGVAKPVRFSISDKDSTANKLNEKGIACIINYQGFRLWGNRAAGGKDFLSVTRTVDVIEESIVRAHLWAVDRNITRGYFEEVTTQVNAYLRQLTTLGAIAGGVCSRDVDLNSPESIRNGEAYFRLELTPSYPAEHIVFVRKISDTYLTEVLK